MYEQVKEIVPLITPIVALSALIVSIFALGIPIRKEIKKSKIATVTGWFASSSEDADRVTRFVIANLGPATAKNIKVTFTDLQGQPWSPYKSSSLAIEDAIIDLSAGDQFHVRCSIPSMKDDFVRVKIEWEDNSKKGKGIRESNLSLLGIPLGSHGLNDKVIVDKVITELAWRQKRT